MPNSKPGLVRVQERVEEWDTLLRERMLELKKKKPVILIGDLNVGHKEIDLKAPKGM